MLVVEAASGRHLLVATLDGAVKKIEADALLPFFGLSMALGPIADWGLALERNQIAVEPATMATSLKGIYGVGDVVDLGEATGTVENVTLLEVLYRHPGAGEQLFHSGRLGSGPGTRGRHCGSGCADRSDRISRRCVHVVRRWGRSGIGMDLDALRLCGSLRLADGSSCSADAKQSANASCRNSRNWSRQHRRSSREQAKPRSNWSRMPMASSLCRLRMPV